MIVTPSMQKENCECDSIKPGANYAGFNAIIDLHCTSYRGHHIDWAYSRRMALVKDVYDGLRDFHCGMPGQRNPIPEN